MVKQKLLFFGICIICVVFVKAQQPNMDYWHGDTVDVIHYDIHLNILSVVSSEISGNTVVKAQMLHDDVSEFAIDLLRMNIDSISLNQQAFTDYTYNDTIIHFSLSTPLSKQDIVTIDIYYHGIPRKDSRWGGFYFSSGTAYNMGVGMNSDPVLFGRCWYPCVDDFVDRALYDFYIRVRDGKKAVCGGTLIDIQDNGDATKTFHWKMNHRIPTYLSSVAVADYAEISDSFEGIETTIPISIFVKHEDSTGAIGSLRNLKAVLHSFESLFGPYPFERIGFVGVPFASGAMEHVENIALPSSSLNGSLDSETLFYHELSHMWFGDHITCKTAADMWLNEGWASYCESVFLEQIYSKEKAKNYVRNNLENVLQKAHKDDGDFYALNGIPLDLTYGTTVYDKGSAVVHTLRNYLGDELFFNTIKAYMIEFGDSVASSYDFRDFISQHTDINMDGFFDNWVFTKGFPHYSIDSFVVSQNGEIYTTLVSVKQKLRARTEFSNSNRVEVLLMDKNWNEKYETIEFSGETGQGNINSDFEPTIAIIDPNEKMGDAISSYYRIIKESDTYNFDNAHLKIMVEEISDSAYIFTEFNWVKPDLYNRQVNGMLISEYNYWKISGIVPENFKASAKFYFNTRTYSLSEQKSISEFDTLRLVYRENAAHNWKYIPQSFVGTSMIGEITVTDLQMGEYALANNVWSLPIKENNKIKHSKILHVYPNPANDFVNINIHKSGKYLLNIYDVVGNVVYAKKINTANQVKEIVWNPGLIEKGNYIISLIRNEKILDSTIVIIK